MNTHLKIDWSNPASMVSAYFSVGEVTQGDPRRVPAAGSSEEQTICDLAQELDAVREAWGAPIGVTSWYRPYEVNLEVGGATDSQHLTGGAADIYPLSGDGQAFEDWLDDRWGGALGYGQESGGRFTHVDLRGGGYVRGDGDIRWTY